MNGIDMTTKDRKESTSAFGYFEMAEFAKSHDDPRVLLMWRRIEELRRKLAVSQAAIFERDRSAATTEAMR